MEKMWAGRFQKALDKKADDFNSSIRFDCRMYAQDIRGSIAHAKMLGSVGILSSSVVCDGVRLTASRRKNVVLFIFRRSRAIILIKASVSLSE